MILSLLCRFSGEATEDVMFQDIDINPCPLGVGNEAPNYFASSDLCKPTTLVGNLDILDKRCVTNKCRNWSTDFKGQSTSPHYVLYKEL